MAVRAGMYSSNKRKKELMRQKKQEEKRLRRQKNVKVNPEAGVPDSIGTEVEPSAETPVETEK
jgi:hypothetical protein